LSFTCRKEEVKQTNLPSPYGCQRGSDDTRNQQGYHISQAKLIFSMMIKEAAEPKLILDLWDWKEKLKGRCGRK
jgi:hypothetical protein